jgi:SAM-dependent methyltransferase
MAAPMNAGDVKTVCPIEPQVVLGEPEFTKSGIDIYVCPSCGSFLADSGYDATQYGDDYYTIATPDLDAIEYRWGFRWRYVLGVIVEQAGSDASVLDVGAGNGFFVKVARDEFGLDAAGIEISPEAGAFAGDVLGVDLLIGDISNHDETYDVVTAFSVIEHVADPLAMVEMLASKLKPGGLLVLATPNPSCIQRRVKGVKRWAMICPPHHLNVLTTRGVEALLGGAGFEIIRRETISTHVKSVQRFDTSSQVLRRLIFRGLRMAGLGADQLVFARAPR